MQKRYIRDILDKIAWKFMYSHGSHERLRTMRVQDLEKKTGTDFGGQILQEEMGYTADEGNDYTASWDYIRSLFYDRITKKDSIIDLGCGKGYAMHIMAQFPFSKIYGIEKSEMLSKIAVENLNKIYPKDKDRFRIWTVDATEMLSINELKNAIIQCNYIYIFNSFPEKVMKVVLNELEQLMLNDGCKHTLFYAQPSPECLELVENSSCYKFVKRHFEERYGGVYEFYGEISD